jgi:hypothetical protein
MSSSPPGPRSVLDVDVLEGDLTGGNGPASLFIDRFGFGVGRVGAFGVWNRPFVNRGAWYRGAGLGAAAIGGAALGAAAASAYPYYGNPYYGPTCGPYPYPPCY